MLAALGGHTDCVHILLEKGAKADAADKKGFSALHRAVSVCAVPGEVNVLSHHPPRLMSPLCLGHVRQ